MQQEKQQSERPRATRTTRVDVEAARGTGNSKGADSATSFTDTPVIDYEGSGYRTDFWEGRGREYEDATERLAIQHILPLRGGCIAEIGAGFGRLADLYLGHQRIILFDYSRTLLADAVSQWGDDERFVFVAGNVYELPLATGVLDSLVMVRVMHHLADVPKALSQLARTLHSQSTAVLEYANKRNLKSMLRWISGRQTWSPFTAEPLEFVALNFDFHPRWMNEKLHAAGLQVEEQLAVSHFRLPLFKRALPTSWLAAADRTLFVPGGRYPLAPSVFVRGHLLDRSVERAALPLTTGRKAGAVASLFCCPTCGSQPLHPVTDESLTCTACGRAYQCTNGIWDFKSVE